MINFYLEQAQLNVEQQLINAELEKLEQYLNRSEERRVGKEC